MKENVDLKESIDGLAQRRDLLRAGNNVESLKKENVDLKESIDGLAQRRDHLRAGNARLKALNSLAILEAEPQIPTPCSTPSEVGGKYAFFATLRPFFAQFFVKLIYSCEIFVKFRNLIQLCKKYS